MGVPGASGSPACSRRRIEDSNGAELISRADSYTGDNGVGLTQLTNGNQLSVSIVSNCADGYACRKDGGGAERFLRRLNS